MSYGLLIVPGPAGVPLTATHTTLLYGMLALAAGVRPLVVTAHGSDVLLSRHNIVYRHVLRRVFRSASLVTVPSDEMREAVIELAGRQLALELGVEKADAGGGLHGASV